MSTAVNLRDTGISRVLSVNAAWRAAYETAVKALPKGRYTGETIRLLVRPLIGEPSHPNAWGGAFNGILKRTRMFRPLAKLENMRTPRSHARLTRVYSKTK